VELSGSPYWYLFCLEKAAGHRVLLYGSVYGCQHFAGYSIIMTRGSPKTAPCRGEGGRNV